MGLNLCWTPGPNWVLEVTRKKKECMPGTRPPTVSKFSKQYHFVKRLVRITFRMMFLEVSAVDGNSIGYQVRRYRKKSYYLVVPPENREPLTGMEARRIIESLYAWQQKRGRSAR